MPIPTVADPRAADAIRPLRSSWKSRPRRDAFVRLAARYKLNLLVVFGSRARGISDEESDVDIGFLPETNDRIDLMSMYCDLVGILGIDRIDLVDLRDDSPLLNSEVAKDGLVLYASSRDVWESYRRVAVRRSTDLYCLAARYRNQAVRYLEEKRRGE